MRNRFLRHLVQLTVDISDEESVFAFVFAEISIDLQIKV